MIPSKLCNKDITGYYYTQQLRSAFCVLAIRPDIASQPSIATWIIHSGVHGQTEDIEYCYGQAMRSLL